MLSTQAHRESVHLHMVFLVQAFACLLSPLPLLLTQANKLSVSPLCFCPFLSMIVILACMCDCAVPFRPLPASSGID